MSSQQSDTHPFPSRVEIRGLLVKTIMTVTVAILYSKVKIQAIILASLSSFLFYSYVRWVSAADAVFQMPPLLPLCVSDAASALPLRPYKSALSVLTCSPLLFPAMLQQPHFNQWINHFRAGLYCMVAWGGLVLVALAFLADTAKTDEEQYDQSVMLTNVSGVMRWLCREFSGRVMR
jgi:hypothetical protein